MRSPLILIRHARAEAVASTGHDIDRPLSSHGQRQAEAIAGWLNQCMNDRHYQDWIVLHSPSVRTTQTAQLALSDWTQPKFRPEERIWNANANELLQVLDHAEYRGLPQILIGHNPGLEQLAYYLTGQLLPMGTGSALQLEWQPGKEMADVTDRFQPSIDCM